MKNTLFDSTLLGNVKIVITKELFCGIFCKKQIIEIQTDSHGKFLFNDRLLQ